MNEPQSGISQVETPEDMGPGQEGERNRWLAELKIADKNDETWRKRADKVIARYRDERDAVESKSSKMNMLWSNTQTILPALYARTPKPMVDRRYKKKDPIGLMAARVLEDSASCILDDFDFDDVMEKAAEDYQLPGRAVARVIYKPTMKDERFAAEPIDYQMEYMPNYADPDNPLPVQGEAIYAEGVEWDDEGPHTIEEVLDYETAELQYVYWKDFRMGRAKKWEDVPWVAFRSYMTKDKVEERFGSAKAEKMRYKHRPDDDKGAIRTAEDEGVELLMKAEVWEIWDKEGKKCCWVSRDYKDGLLDKCDPHLKLHNFYPCTKPLIMCNTTSSMIPVPEFTQYQDQAEEVDDLTNRIAILVRAIRVAGVYDQSLSGLNNLLNTDYNENKLYPIANWSQFMDKGGLANGINWLPIEQMVKVVQTLYQSRESAIQKIYEVTGIADIVRGASDPRETAAAQQIKGRFASLRIQRKQKLLNKFAKEAIQLLAEVIAEHFDVSTLQEMTGITYETMATENAAQAGPMGQIAPQQAMHMQMMSQQQKAAVNEQMWEQVMDLLRNDPLRRFRIQIETDSTIQPDEMEEKSKRIEFLDATGRYMMAALQIGQASPEMTPLLTEMLMFGVRGFRAGRELEDKFEEVMEQVNARSQQMSQQPQQRQDPRVIEATQKAQAKTQEHQMKLQMDGQKHQQEMQQDQERHVLDMQQARQKMGLDAAETDERIARNQRESLAKMLTQQKPPMV